MLRAHDVTSAPPVDSPEWWARVEREPASNDPDVATAQVVGRMARMAVSSAKDPAIVKAAQVSVERFRGGPMWSAAGLDPFGADASGGRRELAIAESAWWYAKTQMVFAHHSLMIWDRWRERDQWQLLISPEALLRLWPMKGDCAVYSTLIASILEVWGVPWEFVTDAADPEQPGVFSHVYVRAILPDGRGFDLDASHGDYPGWHVPNSHTWRRQAWDSSGRPVESRAPEFRGLHYYASRKRGRGLLGLGDTVCDESGCYDAGSINSTTLPSSSGSNSTNLQFPFITQPTAIPYASGSSPGSVAVALPPSSPGTNWGGIFGNLLNQWTQIGGRVIAPTVTYTRGPGGTLSYSAPAGSASSPPLLPGVGGGSSLLWIGGAVVALLVVVSIAKK